MPLLIDDAAKETALRRWVLPACLHVPVAAVDEATIRTYIGDVEQVLAGGSPSKALLVTIAQPPEIDPLLPTCDHPNAAVLHARRQVWVHIAFNRYRAAYRKAFPEEAIAGKVLSHAMNRRTAALKGFDYVRLHRFRAAAIPAADSRNNGACHCMDHPRNRQCAGSACPLFITAQDLRSLKSPPPCQPR
jgi:hypothetical protein